MFPSFSWRIFVHVTCLDQLMDYKSKYQKYIIHNQGTIKPFTERRRSFRVHHCLELNPNFLFTSRYGNIP